MFDVIVVGSGPGGTFATFQLRSKHVLVLDVGNCPPSFSPPDDELYAARASRTMFDYLIGSSFESTHNLHSDYLSPKLKAPLLRYVTAKPNGERLYQEGSNFVPSYAQGGLASAWGAGVFEYNDSDLRGYPITSRELKPFFDILTQKIGISGELDDLESYYGSTSGLQPPLMLNQIGSSIAAAYAEHRNYFEKNNLYFGRSRLAVLTQQLGERIPHSYRNWDFFIPSQPATYNPAFTLQEMVKYNQVDYRPNYLVKTFVDHGTHVLVLARNLRTGRDDYFEAKKFVLAAGALNSAKIVLNSRRDTTSRLPLLDSSTSFVPFVHPCWIGRRLDVSGYPGAAQMLVYDGPLMAEPVHASLYSIVGPLRSDFLADFPLTISGNLLAAKYVLPAMVVVQLFYPDDPAATNYLRLAPDSQLEVHYRVVAKRGALERHIIRVLRRIGLQSHIKLCRFPVGGNGIHYAGTLPMKAEPISPFETDRVCRLNAGKNVFVADAATFPRLPSKHHTLTVMANAMRVGQAILEELER